MEATRGDSVRAGFPGKGAKTNRELALEDPVLRSREGEKQTEDYSCRRSRGIISGRGFDSPRLHQLKGPHGPFSLATGGILVFGARRPAVADPSGRDEPPPPPSFNLGTLSSTNAASWDFATVVPLCGEAMELGRVAQRSLSLRAGRDGSELGLRDPGSRGF